MTNKRVSRYRASLTDGRGSQRQIFHAFAIMFSILVSLPLQGCGGSPNSPAPFIKAISTDYAKVENWETLPNASQGVDVFFVYPTTYTATSTLGPVWTPAWNQSLAQAYDDSGIKSQITSKTGVFSKAGTNLYVPYFQQASGRDVLSALLFSSTPQNVDAANTAMQVAYRDIANAFDYYMNHFNKDVNGTPRPFFLAGHSQGSNLLLMLLQDKFSDPSLRKQLVAAYVIGWSVTSDDLNNYPASLGQVGICGYPITRKAGCVVPYNTQAYAGDWTMAPGTPKLGIVQKNAYSVNPLTWVASGPGEVESSGAPASANMGALFYSGQLGTISPVTFTLNPDTGDSTCEIANYTGAQSEDGALVIDPTVLPLPAIQLNLNSPYDVAPFFHDYDYNFFYRNLEQNVVDRLSAYRSQ